MSGNRRDSDPRATSEEASPRPRSSSHDDGVEDSPARTSAAPSDDAGGGPVSAPVTLASTGAIHISDRVLDQWMRARRYNGARTSHVLDQARRDLAAILADARPVDREVTPERWRSRRRPLRLDVTLLVQREVRYPGLPAIAVIQSITVRET